MPRGGYHPNAERWGRKSAWQSESPTKTIRVPEVLVEQVMDYAHKLDREEVIDYDTKAKDGIHQSKSELEQLRQERDRLASELVECRASQPQQPNLESSRDRYLASLRLGKQAPEYKRVKKALDGFIALLRSE